MRKKTSNQKNTTPNINYQAPWRIVAVSPMPDYQVKVEFVDGTIGLIKMKPCVMSDQAGVFARLRDVDFFNQVHVSHGAASWPGDLDLAPDAIHDAIKKHGEWAME